LKLEKGIYTVQIPLLPIPEDPATVFTVLSWDGPGVEGIEMLARNGQELLVDLQHESVTPNLLVGHFQMKEQPKYSPTKSDDVGRSREGSPVKAFPIDSVLLSVKIGDKRLIGPGTDHIDRLYLNKLEERNFHLTIQWIDAEGAVCQRSFHPPSESSCDNLWQVCFFNFEEQIEVAAMTSKDIKVESNMRKYLKLKQFLAKRKETVNFKMELGKFLLLFL
jgi:hypothetical protein